MTMKRGVTRKAMHDETVEIQWTTDDGRVYIERHTLPPKAVWATRVQQGLARLEDEA